MLSVTVITPSYNEGQFLERTIRSVMAQKDDYHGRLEHWVIDGGSKDDSVEILKRYSDHLQWVSEKDRGHPDAVNKGLARATGDVIGWLNSDDTFYPGAIAKAMEFLERHPDVDLVYGEGN